MITAYLVVSRYFLSSDLYTGIGAFTEQLKFEAQLKIFILFVGAQELVSFHTIFQVATDNLTLFDAEDFFIAMPSVESLTIEQPDKTIFSLPFCLDFGRHHQSSRSCQGSGQG